MVDCWSQLPGDLVHLLAENLNTLEDYNRLSSVCSSWKHALREDPVRYYRQKLPWLMLPCCINEDNGEDIKSPSRCKQLNCRGFYSISENKIHHFELPEAHGKICRGSSYGWLAMVEDGPAIILLNPVTRRRMDLPPLTNFPEVLAYRPHKVGKEYKIKDMNGSTSILSAKQFQKFSVTKIVLSDDPTRGDCIAMAIYGQRFRLAFCKPGEKQWTILGPDTVGCFDDVIYWRDRFYAVHCQYQGGLVVCNVRDSSPQFTIVLKSLPDTERVYLVVDSFGELMIVCRVKVWEEEEGDDDDDDQSEDEDEHEEEEENGDDEEDEHEEEEENGDDEEDEHEEEENGDDEEEDEEGEERGDDDDDNDLQISNAYWTSHFEVFNYDEKTGNVKKVETLGDYTMFLGHNTSMMLHIDDLPNCKPNCIYFTDDYGCEEGRLGGHDLGIFNLKDGSIERFSCCPSDSKWIWPLPIWVSPSLD